MRSLQAIDLCAEKGAQRLPLRWQGVTQMMMTPERNFGTSSVLLPHLLCLQTCFHGQISALTFQQS